MIKAICACVLVATCTMLGNWFSMKLRHRTSVLEKFIESITKMKTLICFGGYDIAYVLNECFKGEDYTSSYSFENQDNENIADSWNRFVASVPVSAGLTRSDREVLCGFGKNLGITDTEGQINNCELYITLTKERLRVSRSEEISKCRLYRVLGFSLGSAVTLMML